MGWDGRSNCLLSVDGSDFRASLSFWRGWYSHKFKSGGLRYEVALCIQTGWIVWINGPYPAGKWPDLSIYRHRLKKKINKNEFVEADGGYRGDETIATPYDCDNLAQEQIKFDVRARQETVNARMKEYKVLQTRFRHKINKHNMERHYLCFNAVAVLVQLEIQSFNPLYQITDYDFKYFHRHNY